MVVCPAFSLTVDVSEASEKTEIRCLRTKGMPEVTTINIQRRGSRPEYYTTNKRTSLFVVCIIITRGGRRQSQRRPVHRDRLAHPTRRMVQLPEVHLRTVRQTERSLRAQNPEGNKSQGTRDNN